MKKRAILLLMVLMCQIVFVNARTTKIPEKKQAVFSSVDQHQDELIRLSDQIWEFAEIAYKEHKSAKVLADYAEQQGFKVERGVADIPTAFIASYGSGKPIIGI